MFVNATGSIYIANQKQKNEWHKTQRKQLEGIQLMDLVLYLFLYHEERMESSASSSTINGSPSEFLLVCVFVPQDS